MNQFLFGDPEHLPQVADGRIKTRKSHATPAPIGTGPEGATCKGCRYLARVGHRAGSYFKCKLMEPLWTHGAGTDIRASWPACREFLPVAPD